MNKVYWDKLTTAKPVAHTTQGELWCVIDPVPRQASQVELDGPVLWTQWTATIAGRVAVNVGDHLRDKATAKVYIVDAVEPRRHQTVCVCRSSGRNV